MEINTDKIKANVAEMFKKMSRKGRMMLIAIVAILYVPVPEVITWSSAALYIVPVIAISTIGITAIMVQYRLDKAGKDIELPLLKSKTVQGE